MKKIILVIVPMMILITMGGCSLTSSYYYVKITGDGKPVESIADDGTKYPDIYMYNLDGYDKDGNVKALEFTASKNLRKDAYLEIKYRDKVITYEEVEEKDVPEKAMEHLNE